MTEKIREAPRYSLRWTNGDGRVWWHVYTFPCVADARAYAAEHAPAGSTSFVVANGRRDLHGSLNPA